MVAKTLYVAGGSALGGVARYWAGLLAARLLPQASLLFPWDTIAVNILGSFLIGAIAVLTTSENLRLFLMVGVCGGFTTFSSFSLQTVQLSSSGRLFLAAANVAASVLLCVAATALGILAARTFSSYEAL